MYLLDTNVISEIRNPRRCDQQVLAWFSEQWMGDLFVSVITVRELYFGAYSVRSAKPALHDELLAWIETRIIAGFGTHVLGIDTETMRIHARMGLPNADISADSLIAATALRHQLTVATRNTRDFGPLGVGTFNPWIGPTG
jgi:predicted nucleic acid-binding protein